MAGTAVETRATSDSPATINPLAIQLPAAGLAGTLTSVLNLPPGAEQRVTEGPVYQHRAFTLDVAPTQLAGAYAASLHKPASVATP